MSFDPVLFAYGVRTTKAGRGAWTRIGAAYSHAEGAGLTVQLDALSPNGRIVLLERDEQDDKRRAERARRFGGQP